MDLINDKKIFFENSKSLNYIGIIPILIEAIKDQQEQINELKAKFE